MTPRAHPDFLLLLIPLLLLGGLTGACSGSGEAEQAPAQPAEERAVPVRVETATPENVADVARLPADLLPARRAVLAAEVPGVVEELRVDDGDRVRSGALLARVDTRALEQAVAEAEALARQATIRHQRAENLLAKRSITQTQMLDAVTAREVAAARLATARLQFEKSRLAAPWSGQVAACRVEVGDYVQPGQPMVELLDVSRLEVRAMAPASDVPYLHLGSPVALKVPALAGERIEGRIVRLAAELDPGARTLGVEAEIANPEGRLRPGMFAHMEITRQVLEGALLVPLDALLDLGDGKALMLAEDGRARRRRVETGPVIGSRVVVAEGLAAGERVIVEGQDQVGEGQRLSEGGS